MLLSCQGAVDNMYPVSFHQNVIRLSHYRIVQVMPLVGFHKSRAALLGSVVALLGTIQHTLHISYNRAWPVGAKERIIV